MVPTRAWSATTPSIRFDEIALSIKACSRRALSVWGDWFVKSACFPRASPRSAKYHEVFDGIASIPVTNCRSVLTEFFLSAIPLSNQVLSQSPVIVCHSNVSQLVTATAGSIWWGQKERLLVVEELLRIIRSSASDLLACEDALR